MFVAVLVLEADKQTIGMPIEQAQELAGQALKIGKAVDHFEVWVRLCP